MSATAFASSRPLEHDELQRAPVSYPRPSRLATRLELDGPKAEHAAEVLGLHTVGDLLEHLPRDRREARAVAELVRGESATVVVEVRSIASRSVRRRGMRPLVEATVADETGAMKATFFNQPWLVQTLSGRDAARPAREVRGAQPLPRPGARGDDARSDRWRRRRPLPRHRRALLDRDPGARAPPRGLDRRRARAAAGAAASPRATARSRRRAQRRPLPT